MKRYEIRSNLLLRTFIVLLVTTVSLAQPGLAGNKKIMTTAAAKVMAERALIESVYGLKIRATETVQDMVAANFSGTTETKTSSTMKGVQFEEVIYDETKDVAKVTASVRLDSMKNIDDQTLDLKNKVFRRVAFATSTPSQAGPLKALRAAELDAYKQLVKKVVGFTLESQTTVENYILTSDLVKTKVLATIFLATVHEFGWTETGDAYVKMALNVKEVSEILGQQVIGESEMIEVEGAGAQTDDFTEQRTKKKRT